MFDWKKPSVEMLGRWQPWHDGHTELFKRALAKSKKMLNFDKEIISIVQNDSTGAIIAKGELTIVGLPDEFF